MAVYPPRTLWRKKERTVEHSLGACLSIRFRETRHNCNKAHEIRTSRIYRPSPARSGDTAGDTEPEKLPLPAGPVRGRLQG
jgi:hypothetical protein